MVIYMFHVAVFLELSQNLKARSRKLTMTANMPKNIYLVSKLLKFISRRKRSNDY